MSIQCIVCPGVVGQVCELRWGEGAVAYLCIIGLLM